MMIKEKSLKEDSESPNQQDAQENLLVSPRALFTNQDKGAVVDQNLLNYTPLHNQEQENPENSKPRIIIVARKNPQEGDHLTERGSHFKPLRLMANTLEEILGNPSKTDQNPIVTTQNTKDKNEQAMETA
ncbi:hypothetical protein AMTR_s00150p00021570 [Amborella trichopoda]|uniref:Uncharacterized protein n=1 Tax=Amborella trichopoda TaxID=13333 RepID=W1PEP5_AMBTC|nr:hypothetical protein AMTR_s00150p00021570 [Amborella trichopoda]